VADDLISYSRLCHRQIVDGTNELENSVVLVLYVVRFLSCFLVDNFAFGLLFEEVSQLYTRG
jgi:hypothetical protein